MEEPNQTPSEGLPKMNLFEAILGRRTCKEFSQEPVEFEKITQVIEAGMHAPSSGNLQNWQFILVTEKAMLRELFNHTLEQEVFHTAPIGVIVCADEDVMQKYYGLRGKRLYSVQNCAACIENMLLAAHALGLGSCWVGAFDEEKVDAMFNIPAHIRAQGIILFGYPDDKPDPKEQKRLDYLLYFNRYGEKIRKPHLVLRDYSEEWERQLRELKATASEKKGPAKERIEKTLQHSQKQASDFFSKAQEKLDKALGDLKKK